MQRLDDLYYVTISVWFDTRPKNEMHQIQHSFSPIHSPLTLFMKRQPVYLIYSFKGRIQIAHGTRPCIFNACSVVCIINLS